VTCMGEASWWVAWSRVTQNFETCSSETSYRELEKCSQNLQMPHHDGVGCHDERNGKVFLITTLEWLA